jgi:uncharacterized protein (DUF1330 family)
VIGWATPSFGIRAARDEFELDRSSTGGKENPMPAYIISEVSEVVDAVSMERYRVLAEVTIKQYGGRYLVRGGAWESLEGEWALERTILVEFPSWERAKAWYRSPEYAAARDLSRVALKRKMLVVDGVP